MTAGRSAFAVLFLLGLANAIEILNLPGQPQANFKQYSGYYTVGKNSNHHLHYWFVESQNNPATDPVLLWLTGGPGCSGLSALLEEWGPFMINPDGATLRVNPYSWNRNASVLTLEAPAGVGYSYASNGNIATGDAETAEENWEALVAFFNEFPQYKKNDFYVTGESYGGIYVPTLVQSILDNQSKSNINIKGFAIGNGCVNMNENTDALVDFLYGHGLVDETQWKKVESQCCNNDTDDCPFHTFTGANFCAEFVESTTQKAWNGGLNPYNMYSDCESAASTSSRFANDYRVRMNTAVVPPQVDAVTCMDESAVTTYLNRQDVRKALGIPSSLGKWNICSNAISIFYNRQVVDTTPNFKNAINAGLRAMLYSGDVDMACNFLMGQRFSRKLGYPVSQAKTKYTVSGQVGGFHTKYGNNMDFVTVRGAGHMVPTDKPEVAFHIIDAFLNNKKF